MFFSAINSNHQVGYSLIKKNLINNNKRADLFSLTFVLAELVRYKSAKTLLYIYLTLKIKSVLIDLLTKSRNNESNELKTFSVFCLMYRSTYYVQWRTYSSLICERIITFCFPCLLASFFFKNKNSLIT